LPVPSATRAVSLVTTLSCCTEVLLAAIDQAQAAEHLPVFALPSDYFELSATQTDVRPGEPGRISRGVPPLVGLSPYLSAAVTTAARKAIDPLSRSRTAQSRCRCPRSGDYAFGVGGGPATRLTPHRPYSVGFTTTAGEVGAAHRTSPVPTPLPAGAGSPRRTARQVGRDDMQPVHCRGRLFVSAANNWEESYDFLIVRPVAFQTPLVFNMGGRSRAVLVGRVGKSGGRSSEATARPTTAKLPAGS